MDQHEPSPEEMARLAVKIASSLYGTTPCASPFASARSAVLRLDFGDELEHKILKIAMPGREADVLREQQIIPALLTRGFEVPAIEFTQEDADFGVLFTAMPFIDGGWIGEAGRMAPALAQTAYEHLGHFIARLSVLDALIIPGARTAAQVRAQVEHSCEQGGRSLRLSPRCSPRLQSILEQGGEMQRETSGFVHWDGPQVITNGGSTFTVIDWGGAGAGHRLLDLGVFLMGHAFWVLLQQQRCLPIYPGWRSAVLRGFLGGRPLTEQTRLQLHLLGTSRCILDAMTMAERKHPRADDLLTFVVDEDAAFQSGKATKTT